MSGQDEAVMDFLHPEYAGMRSTKARITDLERQLAKAQTKLDHWENGVQDEDCPYLTDVKRAQGTIEAIREWGKDFAPDNEEFDAIMGEGE